MMPKSVSSLRIAPLILALILVKQCSSVSGPVYVNPNAPVQVVQVQPTKVNRDPSTYETQTVYGFLDFTTTIGNTVMVFSPNSAPPPEPPKPAKATIVNSVIETRPPEQVVVTSEIKPSKAKSSSQQSVPGASSVIHVVASSPQEKVFAEKPKQNIPSSKVQIISSQVEVVTESPPSIIKSVSEKKEDKLLDHINFVKAVPQPVISSHVEVQESEPSIVAHVEKPKPVILSSIVEVRSSEEDEGDDDEPVLQVENNIGEPEYDFLSRQPSEFAEETYRVHDIRPSQSKFTQKTRSHQDAKKSNPNKPDSLHPTGLVTKLGGTVVKDGATTIHETSVIGTYISGKYAQVLQSTSHIFQNNAKHKISPSSTLRILKTAAPHINKQKQHIEPTSVSLSSIERDNLPIDDLHGNSSPNHVRASRRPAQATGSFKNRFRNRNSKDYVDFQDVEPQQQQPTTVKNSEKKGRNNNNNKPQKNVELATVSVFSETTPSYNNRRQNKAAQRNNNFKPTTTYSQSSQAENVYTRRFKPKLQATPVDQEQQTSSLYKFKLNRTPGRWQYKTSPKPRVTIRKQNSEDLHVQQSSTPNYESIHPNENDIPISRSDDIDLDSSSSINGDVLNDEETLDNGIEHRKLPVETLKVEISTPADFKDTYYEIATIKSPYTFQVGSVKNTRYITVTSTFEKTLDPEPTTTSILTEPLTENILATTAHIDKEHNLLDSSIATLPPILLSSDQETPPLETLTETFSTTQLMLKTHILPVLREGGNATSYTLTQTYHITRLVTATKTLPPMEAYQFNPSKALKEFNSKLDEAGSELNLELDFGDDNEHDEEDNERRELPADLDLSNIGSEFDLSEVDKSNIPEGHLRPKKKNNNAQKAEVTVEQQQPQPQQQLMQNLSPDQLQQLALLRFLNPNAAPQIPQMNQVITTSKPVLKTETVFESHVIPIFNGVSTSFSTISRPVATVTKTEYEIGTSAVPTLPLPPPPINPLFPQPPQQQQQFQITTAPIVTQTVLTQTQSKILKLTFGAKTAYTTIFSTTVVPTILTTFVTQSVAVQPTAAFPGYFPGAPFAPFPYVG